MRNRILWRLKLENFYILKYMPIYHANITKCFKAFKCVVLRLNLNTSKVSSFYCKNIEISFNFILEFWDKFPESWGTLEYTMNSRITLKLWSSCLFFQSAGLLSIHYHLLIVRSVAWVFLVKYAINSVTPLFQYLFFLITKINPTV